jgi:hypothetical protein
MEIIFIASSGWLNPSNNYKIMYLSIIFKLKQNKIKLSSFCHINLSRRRNKSIVNHRLHISWQDKSFKSRLKSMTCWLGSWFFISFLRISCSTIFMAGCSTLYSSGGTIHASNTNSSKRPYRRMMPLHSSKIYPILGRRESPPFFVGRCWPLLWSSAFSFSGGLWGLGSAYLTAL